jgi:hypothetical protein
MSHETSTTKPKLSNSKSQQELDRVEKEFNGFQDQVKDLTLDRMNAAPKLEEEQQTKLSQKEIQNSNVTYLKPYRVEFSREPFDEKWRKEYEHAKERVDFIAENKEVQGETIDLCTKKFPGQPVEFWKVPTNKIVNGPRYLAEQIKSASYHVLSMDEGQTTSADGVASYTGRLVVDSVKQRLDAVPVSSRKSIFMGASGF